MKNQKLYLAITDGENFDFYNRTTEGLRDMASLYNNQTTRFFEIIIEREIELKYGVKPVDNGELPNMNDEDDIIEQANPCPFNDVANNKCD